MTVKQLIEKLTTFNPNLDVIYEDYEMIQKHINEPSIGGTTNTAGTYREVVVISPE